MPTKILKKKALSAAVAAALLGGTGAAQAAATFPGTTPKTFATELFGAGSDATVLTLNVPLTINEDAAIAAGNVVDIAYTLTNGATFGRQIAASDFSIVTGGTGAGTFQIQSGGAAGDNSVTVRLTVTSDFTANDDIVFTIPSIQNASALATEGAEIGVSATLTPVTQFPPLFLATDLEAETVANSDTALSVIFNNGDDAFVAFADLTMFDAGTTDGDTMTLATLAITDNGAFAADGSTSFFDSIDVDNGDQVTCTIQGRFAAALKTDADSDPDTADGVTLNGDPATSIAPKTATFELTEAQLTAVNPGPVDILMEVDGETNIPAANFTDSCSVAFADPTFNGTTSEQMAAGTIDVGASLVNVLNIPKPESADQTFIRLTNNTGGAVGLRGTLYHQDGTNQGTVDLGTLQGNETMVLNGADVPPMFGISTWDGRARLEVISEGAPGDVTGLILIRSNNTLTNMSNGQVSTAPGNAP